MTDRRRSPFDEFEQFFERLNREFGEEFGGRTRSHVAVDVEDAGDRYVVTANLPGFEKDDIEVELREETLHIAAERESESEAESAEEGRRYLRRERRVGEVERAISLPEPVDESNTDATFENGVLRVELPKASGSESTDIEVQ